MATAKTTTASTIRFKDAYNATYKQELLKELNLTNPHQVPKLEKIVLKKSFESFVLKSFI